MRDKKLISFISCVLIINSATAALNLELTQGVHAPIPIAIMPFPVTNQTTLPPVVKVEQVISDDLMHSGRFEVAHNQAFNQFPTMPSEVNLNYWRPFHLNAIVVGQVASIGNEQYQITFSLVNLFNAQTTDVANVSILASENFNASNKTIRTIAHQMSNLIYQKLTGKPGIFTTRIAYVMTKAGSGDDQTQYALQTADYDGLNAQTLLSSVDPIMSPSWSPDGKQIAFVSFDKEGYPIIYSTSVPEGKREVISSATGLNAAPAFSPNGQALAMVLSKSGVPKINVMNLASKNTLQVTDGYASDTEPNWFPDGNSLVFTSTRSGTPQIYKLNLSTQALTLLSASGSYNANPVVTLNGKTLLMLHGDMNSYNIVAQDLMGVSKTLSYLTEDGLVSALTAAPDNNLVMYSTFNKGHENLAVTSIDGSAHFALPEIENADLKEPTWGP